MSDGKQDTPVLEKRNKRAFRATNHEINVSKVHPSKISEYIRAVYVDGKPRITAFAEHIDPGVYSHSLDSARRRIERVNARPDFEELKELIVSEENERMLRRSGMLQKKAMELLVSTIEASQRLLDSDEATAKDVQAAAGVVKSLVPAFQAINQDMETVNNPNKLTDKQRRERASRAIG